MWDKKEQSKNNNDSINKNNSNSIINNNKYNNINNINNKLKNALTSHISIPHIFLKRELISTVLN